MASIISRTYNELMRRMIIITCLAIVLIAISTWFTEEPAVKVEVAVGELRSVDQPIRLTPSREVAGIDPNQLARMKPPKPTVTTPDASSKSEPPIESKLDHNSPYDSSSGLGASAKEDAPKLRLGIVVVESLTFEQVKAHLDQKFVGGTIVTTVVPGSLAESSGIRETDILVALNGTPLRDGEHINVLMMDKHEGQTLMVDLIRKNGPVTVQVLLKAPPVEMPDGADKPNLGKPNTYLRRRGSETRLGISTSEENHTLATLQSQLEFSGGICVDEVAEGSVARKEGIEPGDVILAFNGQGLEDGQELRESLQKLGFNAVARITVLHKGREQELLFSFHP